MDNTFPMFKQNKNDIVFKTRPQFEKHKANLDSRRMSLKNNEENPYINPLQLITSGLDVLQS